MRGVGGEILLARDEAREPLAKSPYAPVNRQSRARAAENLEGTPPLLGVGCASTRRGEMRHGTQQTHDRYILGCSRAETRL